MQSRIAPAPRGGWPRSCARWASEGRGALLADRFVPPRATEGPGCARRFEGRPCVSTAKAVTGFGRIDNGKPVARRGRKATGLIEVAGLPKPEVGHAGPRCRPLAVRAPGTAPDRCDARDPARIGRNGTGLLIPRRPRRHRRRGRPIPPGNRSRATPSSSLRADQPKVRVLVVVRQRFPWAAATGPVVSASVPMTRKYWTRP